MCMCAHIHGDICTRVLDCSCGFDPLRRAKASSKLSSSGSSEWHRSNRGKQTCVLNDACIIVRVYVYVYMYVYVYVYV